MTRLGTWSWSIENPNVVCARLFVHLLLQYVNLVHNHSHAYRAWLFVRISCEIFCASCAQLSARLVCSIICTMPLSCTSTSWLIYKLTFCRHPQYTIRICYHFICTLVFTSFVNSANAYLVHCTWSGDLGQVLVQPSNNQTLGPMHWWALVWPFDGHSSCFLYIRPLSKMLK